MVCFSFYASCFVFWYVTATRIKLKSDIWASNGLSLKKINRKMESLVVAYTCLSWHFFQSWWCPLYRGFTVVFYISFSTSNAAQNGSIIDHISFNVESFPRVLLMKFLNAKSVNCIQLLDVVMLSISLDKSL